ncbi:MAG TPA: YbhN family protein [Acidimicrobiia bacterium]|nr:YbhN family protein [Acidimicrobiia bacterium]
MIPSDTDHPERETRKPKSRLRRIAGVVVPLAIAVALLVGVLPAIADFSKVWEIIRGLAVPEILLLLLLAAWNILTYQLVVMAALPGLPLSQAFMVGQISTAVSNTVPAGSAVGVGVTFAMFSSYGYSADSIGIAAALTGLWNTFVKLGLPIAALAILAFQGNPNAAMLGAAVVGLAVLTAAVVALVLVVSSDRLARAVGRAGQRVATSFARALRRGPFSGWDDALSGFRHKTAGVLQDRWLLLTAATLLSHGSLFALLLVSLRVSGVPADAVTWSEILAAFAFVRLVTALPVTPGGIGLVEVGMTGALVVAGGSQPAVVAGVLIYRALSYAIQIPIGAACWVVWRAGVRRQRRTATTA